MTLTIDLYDETEELSKSDVQLVLDVLEHARQVMKMEGECELSLSFVDNERIQEINAQYRDKDQPTDVISFALEEMGDDEIDIIDEDGPRVLGDIIVSVQKASEQAESYGHSFQRELGFLVVHGLLHLLGYDHMTEADEKEMFGLQEDILTSFGLTRFE
ncbi:putative rRNA maturation factor [Scopulibacillus darangshiensis]|uniref:Endoribonuclease YbeY n=1 Tax=Scopulibacillus darangshiensis TaxID=442528 RepID=A0A4R2PD13_9BACL|nr:rRNA maturation RNase YbeY [Scopulibacillus darangshiensis]TCP32348.1 putative rRNA maturation factor [Scopulibacillus darangshiensis]